MKAQRIRIHFSKTEAMRYTSHLDLRLTWERTFRRSGLQLAYSEGYTPKPLFNFALPLPLGYISEAEIGDFWLHNRMEVKKITTSLTRALPPGLRIQDIQEVSALHGKKLPSLVHSAAYAIALPDFSQNVDNQISNLLSSASILRKRRGKTYDLRPLIINLSSEINPETDIPQLLVSLKAQPGATGRPDEVLAALDLNPLNYLICRTKIILITNHSNEV